MSVTGPDKKRRLLPRWRPSKNAIRAGELASQKASPQINNDDPHFEVRKLEWEKTHSVEVAGEFVASAIVLNREAEAERAAKFLVSEGSGTSASLS